MATKKKTTQARMASPSYLAKIKKGTVQAGKPKASGSSKAATITRQMQNKGVKDGTLKIGRGGKSYNVYDAATGTWKRGVVKVTPTRKSGISSPFRKGSANTTRASNTGQDRGLNPATGGLRAHPAKVTKPNPIPRKGNQR